MLTSGKTANPCGYGVTSGRGKLEVNKKAKKMRGKIPMARYEPRVADVLEDMTLIDKQVLNTPTNH